MAIKHVTYCFNTLKGYPRPNHFKRRIDGLYPRFTNVVNVFPLSFHDDNYRRNIDFEVKVFSKPLKITVVSNTDVELKELVISNLEEYTRHAALSINDIFDSECGLSIFVCYIKVGDNASKRQETVKKVIDYFNANIRDSRYEEDIIKSLFICCDNDGPDCTNFIKGCLNNTPVTWDEKDRIIIGSGNVLLGSKISQHLEDTALDILRLTYEYLDRFVCTKKTNLEKIEDVAHVPIVENTLYNFVRNGRDLLDIRQLISRDIGEGNTGEEFDDIILETLANRLKCAVLHPLAQKIGLNLRICSICLEEIRITKILKRHVSNTSKKQIRKLKGFIERFEKQLGNEPTEQTKDNKTSHVDKKENDFMVHGLQNDISAALREVETELKKAVKHICVIEKMQFEIEGYFKLAGEEMGKPYTAVPEAMRRELFGIKEVMGTGTIYGQFEVHVRSNEHRVTKEVSEVLRRHKIHQYKIRKVEKEAVKLADIQHENGSVIKSTFPGQEKYREGTLGAFSEEVLPNNQEPQLYALTCAHVVNPCAQAQHDVFVIGRLGQLQKLGVSTPQLTIEPGMIEKASLIDFAAVKVEQTLKRNCVRYMKGEDGLPRKANLSKVSPEHFGKQTVYKCGAKSHCTRGIVCSSDYTEKVNGLMSTDCVFLIESLPGSEGDFAIPGDSGSVVCASMVDPNSTDSIQFNSMQLNSVAMVAMVQSGEFRLAGNESSFCVCFQLSRAIDALNEKSGIKLSV